MVIERNPSTTAKSRTSKPDVSGIAPLLIVKSVPVALAFYRDRLGFDVTFEGPEPDDVFFGIVRRGGAMLMFKEVGVDPGFEFEDAEKRTPRPTRRDRGHGHKRPSVRSPSDVRGHEPQ